MNMEVDLVIVPANQASWEDLQAVFGERGDAARCQCQWLKVRNRDWRSVSVEERKLRLREQTDCGNPGSEQTSGLVGFLGGEPVGWCAVAPRNVHARLDDMRVPWTDRDEDRSDDSVWAVTCFVTRIGYRRRGVATALAAATVDFARGTGCARDRGVSDDRSAGGSHHLGRAVRRQPQHVLRRRIHRGDAPDHPPGGHADRLLKRARRRPAVGRPGASWQWGSVGVGGGRGQAGGSTPGSGGRNRMRPGWDVGSMWWPWRWMTTWWWNQHNRVRLVGSSVPPWWRWRMWWGWSR